MTQENGRAPTARSDGQQQKRQGLDLRAADLRYADLHALPLAHLLGSLTRKEWDEATEEQRAAAAVLLTGANLSEARLEKVYLSEARLEGAILGEAHLEEGYLSGANLKGADLSRVHLEGTYLNEAHLEDTFLYRAHLERTFQQLWGASRLFPHPPLYHYCTQNLRCWRLI